MTPFKKHNLTHRGRAFTLVELLIVMAIIVIVLALGVPAFKFITSSHSVDAALNVSKAMLSRARTQAMANKQSTGLAIFYDAASGRYCQALVTADPKQSSATYLDFTSDTDFQYLPPGIGAAIITNTVVPIATAVDTIGSATCRTTDSYLRLGVIMFDSHGRLITVPFRASAMSTFAAKANSATAIPSITSQIGFALYDVEPFNNQGFTKNASGAPASASLDGVTYDDGTPACPHAKDIYLDGNANGYFVDRYTASILEVSTP